MSLIERVQTAIGKVQTGQPVSGRAGRIANNIVKRSKANNVSQGAKAKASEIVQKSGLRGHIARYGIRRILG